MFTTQEFFKKKPDTALGSHSDTVAKWLLNKLKIKYPWLNDAINRKKFNSERFIKEWGDYLREITPWQMKRAWDFIENSRTNPLAPNLKEFKDIVKRVSSNLTHEEIHRHAQAMGTIISGCECDYCLKNKQSISIQPLTFSIIN